MAGSFFHRRPQLATLVQKCRAVQNLKNSSVLHVQIVQSIYMVYPRNADDMLNLQFGEKRRNETYSDRKI